MEYSFNWRRLARSKTDHLDQLIDALLANVRRHVEQPAVEVERLDGVQEFVQVRLFGQIADSLVLPDVARVFAEHQRLAVGGKEQAQHQLNRGRFAGAVGTQQAKNLAAIDLQVEGLEGPHLLPPPEIAVDLCQIASFHDDFRAVDDGFSGLVSRRGGG